MKEVDSGNRIFSFFSHIIGKVITMNVTKMEGCGNDFIIVDMKEIKGWNISELSKKICDRHYGIGADGLICVKRNPLEFVYYNSDGSQSSFCGNGMRCFAKYCVLNRLVDSDEFSVLCDRWNILCKVESVKVTVKLPEEGIVESKCEKDLVIVCGSRHRISEVSDLNDICIEQSNEYNLSYVKWVNEKKISIKTVERGAGLTLACGSGSYASAVVMRKKRKISDKIMVKNPGGYVEIDLKEKSLSGNANLIFECTWNVTA